MKWLILVAVLLALAFAVGARFGRTTGGGSIAFQPVSDLPADRRAAIGEALARGQQGVAVKIYRDATGASLAAARAAVDQHDRGRAR